MKIATKISIYSVITILVILLITLTLHFSLNLNTAILIVGSVLLYSLVLILIVHTIISPLNVTIQVLKQSNLKNEDVDLPISKIIEINELREELRIFSSINKEQYLSQRQYSENLSHELLTPLAVIRTKTELILQSPNLLENDLLNLDDILQTVRRLSKVNQALILLSKISNNQFVDKELIVLKTLLTESISNFEHQIQIKNLDVTLDISPKKILNSNLNLLSILINNLIKNAVFHNVENGFIQIRLEDNILYIINSGLKNKKEEVDFFNRFISDKKSNDSIGLGLAIVKQICMLFDYVIQYESIGNTHRITIDFGKEI